MKEKKCLLVLTVLFMFLSSLTTISVPAEFSDPYVKFYVSPTSYPFANSGERFRIDIRIDTNIPNNSPQGIVAWGIFFQVNPDSLEIGRVITSRAGYYLWEWADWEWLPYPVSYINIDPEKGFADIAEFVSPTPSYGAGDPQEVGTDRLVSIDVTSRSYTLPCLIDVFNAEYMTPDGVWHQVDIIEDGYYGAAPIIQSAVGSGPIPIDLTDPVGTTWHELYPNYCNDWVLVGWTDNTDGKLSTSDQIEMLDETGWVYEFHVDSVTTTIHWTFKPDGTSPPSGDPAHAEPDETYPIRVEGFMADPIGSVWHQIYPDYCRQFRITSWEDNNPNGVFDPSDQFDFVYEDEPGVTYWAHLDAVSTDIIISPELPIIPEFPIGLALEILFMPVVIYIVWRNKQRKKLLP